MENPIGIHALEGIVYVGDNKPTAGNKFYAFRLSNGERLPGKDITAWSTNTQPQGISSLSEGRLLVVDGKHPVRFHQYNIPDMPVFEVTLGTDELREGGGLQTIPVTVKIADVLGSAISAPVKYRVGFSTITATGNTSGSGANSDDDFEVPRSIDQAARNNVRYLETQEYAVGANSQTHNVQIMVNEDDTVEGTEYFAVVVEGVDTYSPFGYVDRYEAYIKVAIIDNDDIEPCAPIIMNKPLAGGGFQGDPIHTQKRAEEETSRSGTQSGRIDRNSCRTPSQLRENTRYQAHIFSEQAGTNARSHMRVVVHPDLDPDRCTSRGLCAESFDPYLIIFRGSNIETAEKIGEYDDIDPSTGNYSAGAYIDVRDGDQIIFLVTSYSQGIGYTSGTGYYPQGVGYTIDYQSALSRESLPPLPPLRPGVLWTEPVAPGAGKPEPAPGSTPGPTQGSSIEVSPSGAVGWHRETPPDDDRIYLVRWTGANSPPTEMGNRGDEGYGSDWIQGSDCGAATCEFQIADFDPELHYLVQVRSVPGDGDTSWQSARYSPTGATQEPPGPGTPGPGTPEASELAVQFTSDDPTEIKLSWNAVEGARMYRIRDPEGDLTTEDTEFRYRNLYPSTGYSYTVEAWSGYNPVGQLLASGSVTARTRDPFDLTVSVAETSNPHRDVNLSWSGANNANRYTIEVSGPDDYRLEVTGAQPTDPAPRSLSVTGLLPSGDYTFNVKAYYAGRPDLIGQGSATYSTTHLVARGTQGPPYTYAGSTDTTRLRVRWPNLGSPRYVTTYSIEHRLMKEGHPWLASTLEEETTVNNALYQHEAWISDLNPDAPYEYRIWAESARAGLRNPIRSLYATGSTSGVTTTDKTPRASIDLVIQSENENSLRVSWDDIDRSSRSPNVQYEVSYHTKEVITLQGGDPGAVDGPWVPLGFVDGTEVLIENLTPGTIYLVNVVAWCAHWSDEAQGLDSHCNNNVAANQWHLMARSHDFGKVTSDLRGLTVVNQEGISASTLEASWDPAPGAAAHAVRVRLASDPDPENWVFEETIPTGTSTRRTIGSLNQNTAYTVRVVPLFGSSQFNIGIAEGGWIEKTATTWQDADHAIPAWSDRTTKWSEPYFLYRNPPWGIENVLDSAYIDLENVAAYVDDEDSYVYPLSQALYDAWDTFRRVYSRDNTLYLYIK